MSMRAFLLIVFLAIGLPIQSMAQKKYQTHFYGEDAFKKPISLTNSVIRALRKNKDFEWCFEFAKDRFHVTKIDLNHDGVPELLIKGGCGNSANSFFYWIVTETSRRYDPVFFVATMGIDLEKRLTKGYSNISTFGCTANTCYYQLFAFNGRRYIQRRAWEKPNI